MKIKDKKLYYVGGVVRDQLLGLDSRDVDYCYEGNAIVFAKGLNVIKENSDFGTVRVLMHDKYIDIASTRTEFYPKSGHLPEIDKIGCSLAEDLKRRDFTINALAKNTFTDEIIDFFGGINDIKNKKLKVLHDNSFIDDPTRIVRGLKFAIRFNFELDEYTQNLQNKYLENINYDMSYHRLKKELKETFNLNKREVLDLFIKNNIYKLLGEKQAVPILINFPTELNKEYKPKLLYMTYLGLFDLSNFELDNEEKNIIDAYNKIKNVLPRNNYEIYSLFKNIPLESVILYAITIDYDIALNFLKNLAKIKIEISGSDLISLGIPQGKIFTEIFEFIEKCKINTPHITKEEEILLIKERFL